MQGTIQQNHASSSLINFSTCSSVSCHKAFPAKLQKIPWNTREKRTKKYRPILLMFSAFFFRENDSTGLNVDPTLTVCC